MKSKVFKKLITENLY